MTTPKPSKKLNEKCKADTSAECAGMAYALANNGARSLGIHVAIQMNMKTGATSPVFAYRTPKGGRLLILNRCPWCSANLTRRPTRRTPCP